jgi:hypothetical protein
MIISFIAISNGCSITNSMALAMLHNLISSECPFGLGASLSKLALLLKIANT